MHCLQKLYIVFQQFSPASHKVDGADV